MISQTFNWFAHSATRQTDYQTETVNSGGCPLKLHSPSFTRWLVTSECIDRVIDQKDSLTLHFSLVASFEHCYTARLLSEMYKDTTNSRYLHLRRPVMLEIKAVNKCFQLETGDSLAALMVLNWLYMSTIRCFPYE